MLYISLILIYIHFLLLFFQKDNLLHILSRNCGDLEHQRIIKKILNNTNIDQNTRNKNRKRYIDIINSNPRCQSFKNPIGKLISKLKSAILNDSEHSVRDIMQNIRHINFYYYKFKVCTFMLLCF